MPHAWCPFGAACGSGDGDGGDFGGLEHRMLAAVRHINKEFDARGLPMQFPERLRTLVVADGDRLQT